MITTHQRNLYWAHYVVLESDIDSISRFIEFSEANFSTYSIQLAHFLLAVGSEIDILLKEMCNLLDNSSRAKNINDYKKVIIEKLPQLAQTKVQCRKYGLNLSPWISWSTTRNPGWWKAYNSVKHERNAHFAEANLKNALNSISALYALNAYYNHEIQQKATEFPLDLHITIRSLESNIRLFTLEDYSLFLAGV